MMSIRTHPGVMKTLPLFSLLSADEFAALLPAIQQRSYSPRSSILRAGDKPDGFYFIVSGRVKVLRENHEGRQLMLSVLGPNEFFGEMELIDGQPRCATVEAHDMCRVLYIPQKTFTEFVMRNSAVVSLLLRTLVERLRSADQKVHDLVFLDVYGRVALTLLETSLEKDGEWLVGPGCEQIATMVGASREMVSRVLRQMIKLELIRRQRRKLIVIDREGLETVALREEGAQKKGAA